MTVWANTEVAPYFSQNLQRQYIMRCSFPKKTVKKNMTKTVFITGASSGIGAALAQALSGPDIALGLVARRTDRLEDVAARCRGKGAQTFAWTIDVADEDGMRKVAGDFLERWKRIDLVIANAGISLRDYERGGDREVPRLLTETNFLGIVHTLAPFIPVMEQARSGHLVAISSLAAFRGMPMAGAYCASKAAVNTWMESLRLRMRPFGVRVTTVCPGFVDTEMTQRNEFWMPWLVPADRAAQIILRGIDRNKKVLLFPWQMGLLVRMMAALPNAIMDPILAKARKEPGFNDQGG